MGTEKEVEFDSFAKPVLQTAAALVTRFFGERCDRRDINCECCRRWKYLDRLTENPFRPNLTARELSVLSLVSQHLQNKQIAKQLSVSRFTVMAHLRNITQKLKSRDRWESVEWAREHYPEAFRTQQESAADIGVVAAEFVRLMPDVNEEP